MRMRKPALLLVVLLFTAILFVALLSSIDNSVASQTRDKSVDASGGSVFLNQLSPSEGALTRAAASTQTFGVY